MDRSPLRRFAPRLAVVALAVVAVTGCGADSSDSSGSSDSSSSSSSSTSATGQGGDQVFTQAGGDIAVSAGDRFVIELDSNPSTGFVWTVTQAPDAAVVALEDQAYAKPDSSALGASGTERFTFKAVAIGTTNMALEYARPSDPDSPDNTVGAYTVTVG